MSTGVEGALRDELDAIGFVPTLSKLYAPAPGPVSRSTLVERVQARRPDLVAVTAPLGYGKSSFLAELIANDPRPAAWVSLTASENEAAALLTYVALALDGIEPVDPGCVTALWGQSPTIGSPALQRFGAMFAERRTPFVLVLDDVHELEHRDVLDVLPVLVSELPPGSSLLVGGRTAAPLPLGRLRVRRRLAEVDAADLAFDEREAALFLRHLEIDAGPELTRRLVGQTEGWPVALYLAALARPATVPAGIGNFTGEHRYLAEYLVEELLDGLEPDVASFLIDASCLERLSGPICDEVLDRRGSAELLEDLRRRNLLVIPLDDHRQWYRLHHLMTDYLQAELQRRDPDRSCAIHRRAARWFDERGDGDAAVAHAVRGGDLALAESLVVRWFGTVSTAGRLCPSTARWVELFPDPAVSERPLLMTVAALASFTNGEPLPALRWLAQAVTALHELDPTDVTGLDGPTIVAMARAMVEPLAPAEMAAEAAYCYDLVGLGDGHPAACLLRGAAAFMVGDDDEAQRRLHEGADSTLDRPLIVATCLAHLALIDAESGRWMEAAAAARQATTMIGEAAAFPSMVLVGAVDVLVQTHDARGDQAEADRQRCREQLTRLVGVAPWLNLQARVALARAALIGGNRAEAGALITEAEALVASLPGAVGVIEQLAVLRRELAAHGRSQTHGPSSLTTAELRVLQLLPTHLSIAEIAERLYVSRNTVKSQAIAVYRKLGTSSRSGAVEIAAAAGLLHDGIARD